MSSHSHVAVILDRTKRDVALEIIASSLQLLIARFDFGFRGYGGVVAERYRDGKPTMGAELTDIRSATELDRPRLRALGAQELSFVIGGSLRIDAVDRLVDLDVVLHPTLEPDGSACVVFWLERDLYTRIEGEDGNDYDAEAAQNLVEFCVGLGAHDLASGFMAMLLGDRGEVIPFDAHGLARRMIQPARIMDQYRDPALRLGFVNGVRSELVDVGALKAFWKGAPIFETVNGFVVLSTLMDTRPLLAK